VSEHDPHTHDPSGHALAEAAHAAGVVEPVAELPNCDVELRFVVHGTSEHADAVAMTLAAELSARSDVQRVALTVTERE
jgi:hypothetical protein